MDDGPRSDEEALAMWRIAYEAGTRMVAALAHQNNHYPDATPELIRTATKRLAQSLQEARLPLAVFPAGEVMASPDLESRWQEGKLLTVADRGDYLLVEMPHGLCVDLRAIVSRLRQAGVRVILAHPEVVPELLHDSGAIDQLVQTGCLVQVTARNIAEPSTGQDERALRSWVAHTPERRNRSAIPLPAPDSQLPAPPCPTRS
jgi:protein-tyrosine phosphatase